MKKKRHADAILLHGRKRSKSPVSFDERGKKLRLAEKVWGGSAEAHSGKEEEVGLVNWDGAPS